LNTRWIASILLLGIVSCLVVPLLIACIDLVLDSPVSLEQTAHINCVIRVLLLMCPTLWVIAAYLLHKGSAWRPIIIKNVLRFVLTVGGCAAGSLLAGAAIDTVAESQWNRLALALFG
jgi:hypothetical protein